MPQQKVDSERELPSPFAMQSFNPCCSCNASSNLRKDLLHYMQQDLSPIEEESVQFQAALRCLFDPEHGGQSPCCAEVLLAHICFICKDASAIIGHIRTVMLNDSACRRSAP